MAYMDLFEKKRQKVACKVMDFYNGEQKEHLMDFMKSHRVNALKNGLQPRTRNIVKMVVDKSALLFSGKAPKVEVYTPNVDTPDEEASALMLQILENANWIEYFTNKDAMVRMLKTCYTLVQYSSEKQRWLFQTLTPKNCGVALDDFGDLTALIYKTGEKGDEGHEICMYRVWTDAFVTDIDVDEQKNETITQQVPNPYGMIPAVAWHDTNVPNDCPWNYIPEDLVEANMMYNIALSDTEFAAMWNKNPTLFTNARIQGQVEQRLEYNVQFGEKLPNALPTSGPGFVGGPGRIVAVETDGEQVYLEYKKPDVNLLPMEDIISKQVADFAGDWAVNIKLDGNGSKADSGFKLMVEELPNLELRSTRARMCEAFGCRLYKVIQKIGSLYGISLPEGEMYLCFSKPELPVDEKSSEEVWSRRIAEKRATRVDYFMEVKGLSKSEAEAKILEIDTEAPIMPNRSGPTQNTTVVI